MHVRIAPVFFDGLHRCIEQRLLRTIEHVLGGPHATGYSHAAGPPSPGFIVRPLCAHVIVILEFLGSAAAALAMDLTPMLTFEAPASGHAPAGWNGGPVGRLLADTLVVHGGKRHLITAARSSCSSTSPHRAAPSTRRWRCVRQARRSQAFVRGTTRCWKRRSTRSGARAGRRRRSTVCVCALVDHSRRRNLRVDVETRCGCTSDCARRRTKKMPEPAAAPRSSSPFHDST